MRRRRSSRSCSAAPHGWRSGRSRSICRPGRFSRRRQMPEAALLRAILKALEGARRVADLFAGCGTFVPACRCRPCGPRRRDRRGHARGSAAAPRRAGLEGRVTTEWRDLQATPLAGRARGVRRRRVHPPRAFTHPGRGARRLGRAARRRRYPATPRPSRATCPAAGRRRSSLSLGATGPRLPVVEPDRAGGGVRATALCLMPALATFTPRSLSEYSRAVGGRGGLGVVHRGA